MSEVLASRDWALDEYGHAQLGNQLRTRRLVTMAARIADAPAGTVTDAYRTGAEREGAYRFLANDRISVQALVDSSAEATLRRAVTLNHIVVPVDGSSLSFADPHGRRGMGSIGTHQQGGRGVKTMSAIGVSPDGTPLGLLGLRYWTRPIEPQVVAHRNLRPIEEKETRYWLEVMHSVRAQHARVEGAPPLWFQLDSEGDFREQLSSMVEPGTPWVTVRAAQNRRVDDPELRTLWRQLEAQVPCGEYDLAVSERPGRQARTALIKVRHAPVRLLLRDRRYNSYHPCELAKLNAVLALEEGTVPDGEDPIEWLLLTNRSVEDFQAACEVIRTFGYRWRIEEFHRAWKSQCHVEDSQLHELPAIQRWATLLGATAMRIERMKYLARNAPDTPATEEFTRQEIDAVIVLRQPAGYARGDTPTMAHITRWVADLGGYVGPSNGPPGSTVLGRGLQRVQTAVLVLHNLHRSPRPSPKPD
jgi:hypothetical protein